MTGTMGEEEKQQICAQAFQKHLEARKTLACLRSKAREMVESMNLVMRAFVKEGGTGRVVDNELLVYVNARGHSLPVAWPSKEELCRLFSEQETVQKEIRALETELRDMGYGDYIKQP